MTMIVEKLPTVIREKCGTLAGYMAHGWYKEISCQPCRLANSAYSSINNAKRCKKNPEKMKAKRKKYRRGNRETLKVSEKLWRDANPDRHKAHQKRYRTGHPEERRVLRRQDRARRRNVPSEPYTTQQILERWGADCHICQEPIDLNAPRGAGRGKGWERGLHLDHVVPISKGGPDTIENVKPAHGLCNIKKQ